MLWDKILLQKLMRSKRAYKDKYEEHIYVNSTKEANDAAILKERLLELAFEGKRWWDLVRFDKAFDLVPSLREHKGKII